LSGVFQQNPSKVGQFDNRKIVAVGAGDEFSLAVDESFQPWGWGRAEHGQLGFESRISRGGAESVKQSVFKPTIIDSLSELPDHSRPQRHQDSPSCEAPLLDIDLEWDLPDFAIIGSPRFSYGRKALDSALIQLHGFYRTSAVVWRCQDWGDWKSMATIYSQEKQWPQALECSLRSLAECGPPESIDKEVILHIFRTYQGNLLSETVNHHMSDFVERGVQMFSALIGHWESKKLDMSELEEILGKDLSIICFPLSLIIRDKKKFSFEFHMKVAKEVVEQMMNGAPKPEDLINSQHGTSKEKPTKDNFSSEALSSDTRLWTQVMRNLGKDVYKKSSVVLGGSSLNAFNKDMGSSVPVGDVLAFSCGHAFPEGDFESRVLIEFKERVKNFPLPIPQTLLQLQSCYKKSISYPVACPYCVFQHLRQLQLQECPDTPIKPWTL
jgi:hypothetical protein